MYLRRIRRIGFHRHRNPVIIPEQVLLFHVPASGSSWVRGWCSMSPRQGPAGSEASPAAAASSANSQRWIDAYLLGTRYFVRCRPLCQCCWRFRKMVDAAAVVGCLRCEGLIMWLDRPKQINTLLYSVFVILHCLCYMVLRRIVS